MRISLQAMLAVLACAGVMPARADLMAAAGKVDITPTRPVYIAGYGANRLSVGAHDPLWARCLVLRDGQETVAFVFCDLLGVARYHVEKTRPLIKRVPAERVLIGSTHTHSGPDTYGQWGPNPATSGVDQAWMQELYGKIARLVDTTAAALKPASVRFARTTNIKDCSYNARAKILDTELAVMQVLDRAGEATIATLINYACHPEVLNNKQLTSDFAHWLREKVEQNLGGVAIYANGALGGMVTAVIQNEDRYPKGEAWPEAERIGNTLAAHTLESLTEAGKPQNAKLTFRRTLFRVPMESAGFRALIRAGVLPNLLNPDGTITTEVARVTVGRAEFLTLPGEVLPNLGIYLKRKMTGSPRFLLGLTCDALGYILTAEDFGLDLYSYESRVSVGPEMGPRMRDALLGLMKPTSQPRAAK